MNRQSIEHIFRPYANHVPFSKRKMKSIEGETVCQIVSQPLITDQQINMLLSRGWIKILYNFLFILKFTQANFLIILFSSIELQIDSRFTLLNVIFTFYNIHINRTFRLIIIICMPKSPALLLLRFI